MIRLDCTLIAPFYWFCIGKYQRILRVLEILDVKIYRYHSLKKAEFIDNE